MRRLLCGLFSNDVHSVAVCGEEGCRPGLEDWKIIDENRARDLAAVYHTANSSTSNSGSRNGTANSTNTSNGTNTNMNGNYSGRSSTSFSGLDRPLYRVHENLIIEGDDMVYVTTERLRWRWSKAAHVTVNGEVRYYVDGKKLHLLDDVGKEHVIDIRKTDQEGSSEYHYSVSQRRAFAGEGNFGSCFDTTRGGHRTRREFCWQYTIVPNRHARGSHHQVDEDRL